MNGRDELVPVEENDLSDQDLDFYGTPGTASSFISDAKFGYVFFNFNNTLKRACPHLVWHFFLLAFLKNI